MPRAAPCDDSGPPAAQEAATKTISRWLKCGQSCASTQPRAVTCKPLAKGGEDHAGAIIFLSIYIYIYINLVNPKILICVI